MRKLSVALLVLLLNYTSSAFSTELISNGSFDTNTNGWTTNGDANWTSSVITGAANPGILFVSNFCSDQNCNTQAYGTFSQSIAVPSTANYRLSFDYGVRVPSGASPSPNNTNTLTISLGNSQVGTIQFIQNGVNSNSAVVAGTSMTINKSGTPSSISIAGNTPYWFNTSYKISSTAGNNTLAFTYDFKDIMFYIDNISLSLLGPSFTPDIINSNNGQGGYNMLSTVTSGNYNLRFDGGTLLVDSGTAQAPETSSASFTIASGANKAFIDQNNNYAIFNGQ